jgi:hypothetical protein
MVSIDQSWLFGAYRLPYRVLVFFLISTSTQTFHARRFPHPTARAQLGEVDAPEPAIVTHTKVTVIVICKCLLFIFVDPLIDSIMVSNADTPFAS